MKNIAKILIMLFFLMPVFLSAETLSIKNLDQILSEKRAIVKEYMQLTEKESAVFWPLYDDYEKTQVYSFNKWTALVRKYLQERENLSDKSAKEMINEMLGLQAEDVKVKRAYVKKFSDKLPHNKVFKYFILEEKVEAGFNFLIAQELAPVG